MGVHGLWRLIEPSGKPVHLETLENKVLAVDISIWLHQVVKGFQDTKGASVPNAHLLGIYHRICKLLYFKIKPVFVFDGGVPALKKQTIAKRNLSKAKSQSEAQRIHKNLLDTLLKHTALSKVLSEKTKAAIAATSPTKKTNGSKTDEDNLYFLPPALQDSTVSSISDDDTFESDSEDSIPKRQWDLHSIDTTSQQFKSLPVDVRHEILTDLKETRKQSSWGRIHELPTESDDFSIYQMRRLLKRQSVQTALEDVEKEMGGHSLSLNELEKILKDQGVIPVNNLVGNRIASDENTRFLLIKDIRQAIEEAKAQKDLPVIEETAIDVDDSKNSTEEKNKGDVEFEDDLQRAIALSLQDEPSTSKQVVQELEVISRSNNTNSLPLEDADFDSDSSNETLEETVAKFTSVQGYMMEYSGLTPSEIAKIIASRNAKKKVCSTGEKRGIIKNTSIDDVQVIVSSEIEMFDKKTKDKVIEVNSIESKTVDDEALAVVTKVSSETEVIEEVSARSPEEKATEVMSDSDEESDDFLDVTEGSEGKSDVKTMEVVIKLDEEMEDDLFSDIFTAEDKLLENQKSVDNQDKESPEITSTQDCGAVVSDKDIEIVSGGAEAVTDSSSIKLNSLESAQVVVEGSGESLKDKIENMIVQYSNSSEKNEKQMPILSLETMNQMKENLQKEQSELFAERSTKERLASTITDQMYQEAQELLELFGVPYLIAPMEAEAQCAFLDENNLTDGTITDDSDIWLFGGKTVYKNFFNQTKHIKEFNAENIQHHFKLSREQMILLAMLVGSDYTVGLTGVGPVTALEILAAFPPKGTEFTLSQAQLLSGLAEFRSWFTKGKAPGPGRTSLRSKLKNLIFHEGFPNPQIPQAYLEPKIETSKEKFTWAKPDVGGLMDFAKRKFGWTVKKTEEILNPVLKKMGDHHSQTSIRDYFKTTVNIDSTAVENQMSKRVKTAINKIGKGSISDDDAPKAKKKRVVKKIVEEKEDVDDDIKILKQTKAKSRKKVAEIEKEVQSQVDVQEKRKVNLANLHKKEVIPQKQKEKSDLLKNKLKAIETFRKSKSGPGFVKKRSRPKRAPKTDAGYLSENSSDE